MSPGPKAFTLVLILQRPRFTSQHPDSGSFTSGLASPNGSSGIVTTVQPAYNGDSQSVVVICWEAFRHSLWPSQVIPLRLALILTSEPTTVVDPVPDPPGPKRQ